MTDFTPLLRALNGLRETTTELDRIALETRVRDQVETDTSWRVPQSRYAINATGREARR